MIGELPKLFDKNFAIAYFLPSLVFVATAHFIHFKLAKIEPYLTFSKETLLQDISAFGLISLLTAVVLSILTHHIVRFMEGYWAFDLFRYRIDLKPYFKKKEVEYFDDLNIRLNELLAKRKVIGISPEEQAALNEIADKLANRFPSKRDLVLPTSFGNTYRAFENYPKVMYGFEAIDGWFRLLAVIPKDYLGLMNDARARMDFGVNLWFFSVLLFIEYVVLAVFYIRVSEWQSFFTRETLWWFPPAMLLLSFVTYKFARNALALWGNWVKAAFDLYLPELRKTLAYKVPQNAQEESEMWKKFNRAVAYRQNDSIPPKEGTPS